MAKYPEIKVKLIGYDGNAFAVIGRCKSAVVLARREGIEAPTQVEFNEFMDEAMSSDYDHLLSTVMEWFVVE